MSNFTSYPATRSHWF